MRCEDIRESILTDYTDRQLNSEKVKEIDQHLSSCAECRELSETVCRFLVEPFREINKIYLPQDKLWQNIEQRIKQDTAPSCFRGSFINIIHRLRQSATFTKPAFALITITVIVVTAMIYFNTMKPGDTDILQSSGSGIKPVVIVSDDLYEPQSDDYVDYGTDIERYFL